MVVKGGSRWNDRACGRTSVLGATVFGVTVRRTTFGGGVEAVGRPSASRKRRTRSSSPSASLRGIGSSGTTGLSGSGPRCSDLCDNQRSSAAISRIKTTTGWSRMELERGKWVKS